MGDGPARVQELIDLGLKFSRDTSGSYDLGREGGHSARRILHVKDMTGKAIENALLKAISREPRVALFEHLFGIDIIRRRFATLSNKIIFSAVHSYSVQPCVKRTFSSKAR